MKRVWMGVLAVVLVLASTAVAQAATIHVTTTGDPGPSGTTSLRQAVAAAANNNEVSVPAGHYVLKHGAIVVANAIELVGAGATQTVVDANHASGVFEVTSDQSAEIDGLTITGGRVVGTGSDRGGAGIFDADGSSSLTLRDDVVTGNTETGDGGQGAQGGGGIYTVGVELVVDDTTLSDNVVDLSGIPSNAGGAAIFNSGGAVTVSGSTLTGNQLTIGGPGTGSNNGGGAIYNDGVSLAVTGSSLTGNTITISGGSGNDGGGAIYDGGGMTVTASSLTGNTAGISDDDGNSGGGAIYENGGGASIEAGNVSANQVTVADGTGNDGGGGLYNNGGPLNLTSSTVAQNAVTLTGSTEVGGGGGGIYNNGDTPTFVNLTLSDNQLIAPNGAPQNGGGAVYQNGVAGTITSSTVADNSSNRGAGAMSVGTPPTSHRRLNFTLTLKGTIVAGNRPPAGGSDCDGSVVSAGYNLEDKSPSTCGFTATGDLVGVPAGLAPLAQNGGLAPTLALLPGSKALDHIPKAECTTQASIPVPITTDERAVARALDGFCDVGAFESAPARLALHATAGATSIDLGARDALTFTLANGGPAPAIATSISVAVPAALRLVSARSSRGSCAVTHGRATCEVGLVAVNAKTQLTVVVLGLALGKNTITAVASASGEDPTPAGVEAKLARKVIGAKLTGLSVTPSEFAISAMVGFKLNFAASVRFTVEHGKLRLLGSLTKLGHPGANSFKWRGRLSGHKLAPGSYRLIATPIVDGQSGPAASVAFRITAAKHPPTNG